MGQVTNIAWTDHTFNAWRGCTRVSEGCRFCYAEKLSARNHRTLGVWGPNGERAIASESYWRQPFAWAKAAKAAGVRRRVFCASLADVFEGANTIPTWSRGPVREARTRLWATIDATPDLDWLLVTKRPENIAGMWAGGYRHNVWLITSVENQATAEARVPWLQANGMGLCPVLGISAEPLLGPIDLGKVPGSNLDWVIVGGESGAKARPMDVAWVRAMVGWCRGKGIPCFVKQMGDNPVWHHDETWVEGPLSGPYVLRAPKGGDPAEWGAEFRVREYPKVADVVPA